jgi:hypothetical protein
VSLTGTGGTVTNAVTFSNTGTLVLGQAGGTQTYTGGLVATAPSGLTVYGTLATTNTTLTLGSLTTLAADTVLSSGSGAVNLSNTVNGGYALTVNSTGVTTFAAAAAIGASVNLTSVTTNAGGSLVMNGGSVTTTGAQTYNDDVTLGADTTLNGVGITLGSTIKSNGTKRSLSVNDSGTTTFGGAIGSTTDGEKLTSITTDSAGAVAMNAGTVYTTGAQTYNDAVTLGADTTLTGTTITTNGTLAGGSFGLTVTGNAVFGNDAADTITGLSTLSVSGTTGLYTNTVTSSSTQQYSGSMTLTVNAIFETY